MDIADKDTIRRMTQVEQNQKDIDELISLMNVAAGSDGCGLCDGNHPSETRDNALLCRHKKSYLHIGCCSSKCSWHGAPCRHAIILHK